MDKMSNGLVSIIIVTAGHRHYLKSLLDSLEKQTSPVSETLIINNSPDVITTPRWARVYNTGSNMFYCQALNLGIRESNGEFILCLNDDVELERDFIKQAEKGFFIDSRIGMVSGKILRSDKATLDSTGLFLSVWLTARERGYGALDRGRFEREEYVFGVNGAVAFYRRKMMEDLRIGSTYFDEDYRIFYEDLDIAWRAKNRGWRGYYMPKAIAFHVRGATVRAGEGLAKPFARRYLSDELHLDLLKNRYLTIAKNISFAGILLRFPFVLIYEVLNWSYVLFFRRKIIKKIPFMLKCLGAAFEKRKVIRDICLGRKK